MFCHQCGKELHENDRFCSNCGTPIRDAFEQPETADALQQAVQTEIAAADPQEPPAQIGDGTGCPQELSTQADTASADATETASPPQTSGAEGSADLILKRGRTVISGSELHLHGKHYTRKHGKRKFKKKKKSSIIPFDAIRGTSMEHRKYGGRIFLSLLLLVCFTAGSLFSARRGYDTYIDWNTPYQDEELPTLEDIMELIDNSGTERLLQYRKRQEKNRADADDLSAELAALESQQSREILDAVYKNEKFDLDTFFNNSFFSLAYQEYLQDLLTAFKEDELLNSWLYSYYETVREYDGNYFLDTDMWIYNSNGENRFSTDLDSVSDLIRNQYDLDFYEHMLYTGHIYITAADFMKDVLSLPRYIVDSAVFVMAFGGTPNTAEMSVPGWSRSHYEEFWLYGSDYYHVDTPIWLDYGLTAQGFDIDWNSLTNETAYYNAYKKFMDKIAPGLPYYDMSAYYANDEAYGGMGYDLKGTEAPISDIVASYSENHPEFIEELKESGLYNESLTTSVDKEITEVKIQLEELDQEFQNLEEQKNELGRILADADIYRSNYAFLLSDIERHTQVLTYRLLIFGGAFLLCAIASLTCLCQFFGFLKRPRHLYIISQQDMDFAFNASHYSKEQIAALQSRLPKQ